MKKDLKQGVIDAITKYEAKQAKKYGHKTEPKKTNEKPEKQVEKDCLLLMRKWGWSVDIFEAKATFDPRRNIWRQQAMKAGVCDCMGSTSEGIGVAVEFKAPGAISSFNSPKRIKQKEFIVSKIMNNNFACVVDSASALEDIYNRWTVIRTTSPNNAREFLLSRLPKTRSVASSHSENLFEPEDV